MNLMKGQRGEPLILEADARAAIAAEPNSLGIAEAENGRFLIRVLSITEAAAEFHIIAQLVEPWQALPISGKRDHAKN